jgi:CRP-like cAMP-binding protein
MPIALISKLQSFSRLSDNDKKALMHAFLRKRTVAAGEDILHEDDVAEGLVIIISGLAGRFRLLGDGRRQIVGYLLPGDLVDYGSLASDRTQYGVRAFAPTTISRIASAELLALMSQSPELIRALWSTAVQELSLAQQWILNLGQRDAEQRLAHLFCEQYYRMREIGQAHDGAFNLPLTQRDLADSVGLSNVHVNRVLQKLRREHMIAFDGVALKILDLAAVERIAEFDPHYLQLRRTKSDRFGRASAPCH